ncbi:MAG: fibronectin type III domain-containing protein [Bifidobacterium choerinum]
MADGYGGVVAGSWRCHTAAWIVSQTDTSAVIRVEARFQAVNGWHFAINGISGSVRCNGQSGSGTGNANIGTNGEAVICRKDFTVAKNANARNVSCSATVSQSAFNGGVSSASCNVAVPGVTYLKPNPPKNVSWTRASDSSVKCAWQSNWDNAARKPWHQLHLWIRERVGGGGWGAWTARATLNWDATNYTYGNLKPNAHYQFGMWASNPAGDSTHVDNTAGIHTTPSAPRSVVAARLSSGRVRIGVDVSNSYATGVTVERSFDGAWTTIGTASPVNGQATIEDASVPAGVVQYRALGRVPVYGTDTSRGMLSSAWALSTTLSTIETPKAPTVTVPTGIPPVDATANISWTPNHPDGSTQTAAQVKITRPLGGGDETLDITDAQTTASVACPTPGDYTVQVRTKGLAADWGPWSSVRSWHVANPPSVNLKPVGESDVITQLPIVLEWTASDWDGIARQQVHIIHDGMGVYSADITATARSLTIPAASYLPTNGASLLIEVTVHSGNGLSTTSSRQVTVAYTPPATPTGVCTLSDGYMMMVQATAGTDTSAPATAHLIVERVDMDGVSETIADDIQSGGFGFDYLPPLGVDYTYRVTAVSTSGAAASTDIAARIDSDCVVFNFGLDASEVLAVGGAWKLTDKPELDTTEYHFADDTGLPRSYGTGDLDDTITISSSYLWSDATQWRHIRHLARTYSRGWLRTLDGARMRVRVSMHQSLTANGRMVDFSADCKELAWEEPQHG